MGLKVLNVLLSATNDGSRSVPPAPGMGVVLCFQRVPADTRPSAHVARSRRSRHIENAVHEFWKGPVTVPCGGGGRGCREGVAPPGGSRDPDGRIHPATPRERSPS